MSHPASLSVDSSNENGHFPNASDSTVVCDSSELWFDDACLGPMTAEPGYSKLCNACIRVFSFLSGHGNWVNHIKFFDTLKQSARRGCVLCALMLYKIEGTDPSRYPSPHQDIKYGISFPPGDDDELGVTLWCSGTAVQLLMLPFGTL